MTYAVIERISKSDYPVEVKTHRQYSEIPEELWREYVRMEIPDDPDDQERDRVECEVESLSALQPEFYFRWRVERQEGRL